MTVLHWPQGGSTSPGIPGSSSPESTPIDALRFAHFGEFVAGIAGFVNFLLLIYVYSESKAQSFQSSFFNHLNVLTSIVKELVSKEGDIKALNVYSRNLFSSFSCEDLSEELQVECEDYRLMKPANGYFEILYRILHIRYKYIEEPPGYFFRDENWRIGHYFKTFVSVVETIRENHGLDTDRIEFYVRVLKSRSTSDELRLILYYIISRSEEEQIRLAKLFNFGIFDFFDDMEDGLIKPGDMDLYKEILIKGKTTLSVKKEVANTE
jgi:hypothetical protein